MRPLTEIDADIETCAPPRPKWRTIGDVRTGLAQALNWRHSNPEQSARYDALCAEREEVERCEQELTATRRLASQAEALLERSGVGLRSREAATHRIETEALVVTREWLDGGKIWLLLAGGVGSGKTVAAACAVHDRLLRGDSAAFRNANVVLRMSGFDEGARELARLKRVQLLVLDDFAQQPESLWGKSILHELLDARHEAKLRTIITANIERKDARAKLGDRLVDRIAQDGAAAWLSGGSMRRERKNV